MHESGAVGRALDAAFATAPPGAVAPRAVELVVTDPVHIAAASAELHLQLHLGERGLADVPIRISVRPVTCVFCGVESTPDPSLPFCEACGLPFPPKSGPGVEIAFDW
jgi:hypothetical protein